jgi:pimeloyl-ACP methyl ester carboxylesterase
MSSIEWRADHAVANGIRIAWDETGDPCGAPLVLVMGLATPCTMWPDALCADLAARGFRVIRFYNRDIGGSQVIERRMKINLTVDWLRVRAGLRVRAHYTLHDMVADTAGLLDALRIERAHLVGVSMGGMIAQLLAAHHPRRVASLTSIMSLANHPWYSIPRLPILRLAGTRVTDGVDRNRREAYIRRHIALYRAIGSPAYPPREEDLRLAFGRAFDRGYRPGGVLRQTHAIMATRCFEEDLARIVAPTQVIHGLADPLVPAINGKRCARRIRGARLELIEGMGHDLPAPLLPRIAQLVAANVERAAGGAPVARSA